jgi:hypothetical protein
MVDSNQYQNSLKRFLSILGMIAFFLYPASVFGTELYIPAVTTRAGQSIEIPIRIDHIDNLAGVKIVMKYDPNLLIFRKASKTNHTSSLMHIVNDKKPGHLIVVMAGAKGIKGDDFSILTLFFDIKGGIKTNQTTRLKITEVQLMSDELKDLKFTININPIAIKSQ